MSRLAEFDRPLMVSWKRGWYPGVVLPEYESSGGAQVYNFRTEDRATQSGQRQVQLCIGLVGNGEVRNFNFSVYYSPEALFNNGRLAELTKMAKAQPKGRWNDTGAQREYMGLVQLHEIEKALNDGNDLPTSELGGLDISNLIGKQVDAFYSIYHKVEKDGRKFTDEVDLNTLKDLDAGKTEWQKGWFGGIKYLAAFGTKTEK